MCPRRTRTYVQANGAWIRRLLAEDFSTNTVQGACPTCHGLGRVYDVPEELMVPDDSLSIRDRALAAWPTT